MEFELARVYVKRVSGELVKSQVDSFLISNGSQGTSRETDLFFLAVDQNRILGSVRFCVEENTPMLRSMMIAPEARGQHIGTSMLQEFATYLDENAIENAFCLPYSHLVPFYAQIGFEKVDEEMLPHFLQVRLAGYRSKNSAKSYIAMKRPGKRR